MAVLLSLPEMEASLRVAFVLVLVVVVAVVLANCVSFSFRTTSPNTSSNTLARLGKWGAVMWNSALRIDGGAP